MRLLLAAPDPIPSAGPLPAERGGRRGARAADACEHASDPTAGPLALETSQVDGGSGPARSGESRTGASGGSALHGEGSDGGGSSLRYMLAWYSLVAPALGLPMPLALWTK